MPESPPPPAQPHVLIVQTGHATGEVLERHGPPPRWFAEALPQGLRLSTVVAIDDEALPDPTLFDGVILTGSSCSVRDEAPWMAGVGTWALEAATSGTPVLGVCFGHQLLGEALGGWVDPHPNGRELGTQEVTLTPEGRADPLFAGLPDTLVVQQLHGDALLQQPPGVIPMATSAHTSSQSFALGENLRTVQFHPELTPAIMTAVLHQREWSGTAWESDHGRRILANWVAHWLRPEER